MRRVFKYIGYVFAALLLLLGAGIATVYGISGSRLAKHYEVPVNPVAIPAGIEAVARGKHIAQTRGCVDCHGADFGGAKVVDDPAIGKWYGPNLTAGRGGKTANYTDADWVRAIRHGISKDGRALVLMPSLEYQHFTDEDLGDVIAYVKSQPAVDRDSVPVTVGPVARVLILKGDIKLAAEHIDHAGLKPTKVATGVTVEYGRYVATSCVGCHGENLAGGKIPGAPPDWPASRNLTPSGDLAKWSEADFIKTLQTGARPDGAKLNPVMPIAFGQMTETELKALWSYIKTVPAAPTKS